MQDSDETREHERDLATQIRAAEALALSGIEPGCEKYRKLEQKLHRLPEPLREAVSRSLLELRRAARRREVFSRAFDADEEGEARGRLRQLATRLREGDLARKMALVEELVDSEAFEAAPVLVTRLSVEGDELLAAVYARAAGYLGGEACVAILEHAARAESRDVRLGAVEGLRFQVGTEAVRILLERLTDRDPRVRRSAQDALESRSPEALLEILRELPPGSARRVLVASINLLERWIEHEGVRGWLWDLVGSKDIEILARAAGCLQRSGDPTWREALPHLEWSADPRAARALAILRKGEPDPLDTDPDIEGFATGEAVEAHQLLKD